MCCASDPFGGCAQCCFMKTMLSIPTKHKELYFRILQAITISFLLWLVGASRIVAACGFASSIIAYVFKDKKALKYLSILPFVFSFFVVPSKFLVILSAILFIYWQGNNKKDKRDWFGSMVLPVALYFIIELLQKNLKESFRLLTSDLSIQHYGHLYGITVIIIVVTFLHLFFSKKVSWYIATGLFSILGITNFFVVSYTSQGFIPSDFKIAKTGFACLGSQALTRKDIIILSISLAALVAFVAAVTLLYKGEKKDARALGKKATSLTLVLVFVFCSWMSCSWFKNNLLLFNAHSKYGFITNFVVNLDSGIDIPEEANDYRIADADNEGDFKPNVIIVMNEAFSDLPGLFDLKDDSVLEYFNSLRAKYPSGTAYTSVKGNNTCSSEWECLSGVSTALTAKGAVIYQDNCKYMNSLVNVFNRRGYYTVGVHPYHDFGYNRKNIYEAIGFQDAYFMDSFDDDADRIHGFITDEEDYKKVIELYEQNAQNGDAPFFCFNITMMNHGGYDDGNVEPRNLTPFSDANEYLAILHDVDKQLKTLIEYFEKVDEPTIILFFGDHQPAIDNAFYEKYMSIDYDEIATEQLEQVYQTPYLIWANYELNEDANPKRVSINYLSSVLLEVGNIPSTTWIDKLKDFRDKWPIVTANFAEDAEGNIYSIDAVREEEYIKEYALNSYAILLGEEK